jgi:hypothetical protein
MTNYRSCFFIKITQPLYFLKKYCNLFALLKITTHIDRINPLIFGFDSELPNNFSIFLILND